MSSENEGKLVTIECSSCGGNVIRDYPMHEDEDTGEMEVSQVPVVLCSQCGKKFDAETEEYYQLIGSELTEDETASDIFELGLKATIDGKVYEIIGRIRYVEEPDFDIDDFDYDEDDEDERDQLSSMLLDEFGLGDSWNEWLAVSDDGVYHYFVEEESGKIFSHSEYIPQSIDLESDSGSIEFDGERIDRDEGYYARVIFAEGEFPYEPEIGERVLCFDIEKDGDQYSVEQGEGEVSITKGERIDDEKIIEVFGSESGDEHEKITRLREKVAKKNKFKKSNRIYKYGILIMLALCLYGSFYSKAIKGTMNNQQILTLNAPEPDGKKIVYKSQVLYGPIDITSGGKLYTMSLDANLKVQEMSDEWQSLRLMLIDNKRLEKQAGDKIGDVKFLAKLFSGVDSFIEPLESYAVTGEFWDESGVDSEGYSWHESALGFSPGAFIIDEPGKYYFYLESYSNKKRKPGTVLISFEEVISSQYYYIALVILLCLFFYTRSKVKSLS